MDGHHNLGVHQQHPFNLFYSHGSAKYLYPLAEPDIWCHTPHCGSTAVLSLSLLWSLFLIFTHLSLWSSFGTLSTVVTITDLADAATGANVCFSRAGWAHRWWNMLSLSASTSTRFFDIKTSTRLLWVSCRFCFGSFLHKCCSSLTQQKTLNLNARPQNIFIGTLFDSHLPLFNA